MATFTVKTYNTLVSVWIPDSWDPAEVCCFSQNNVEEHTVKLCLKGPGAPIHEKETPGYHCFIPMKKKKPKTITLSKMWGG